MVLVVLENNDDRLRVWAGGVHLARAKLDRVDELGSVYLHAKNQIFRINFSF